jgi:hypothetical protein
MPRPGKTSRPRKRTFAESVKFPRWIVSVSVLIIGFVFWLGAVSEGGGAKMSGLGSALYFAAVAGVAAFSLYGRRNER